MLENATGLRKDVTVVLLGHEEQGYREHYPASSYEQAEQVHPLLSRNGSSLR